MDKREQMIRLWFSMWLEKKDLGMDDILSLIHISEPTRPY